MTSAARRLRVAGVLASAVAVLGVAPRLASAGGETHRAAVVVDLGDEVKTARVTFEGDSITGLEALQLAGFDPVARAYGGQGGAVCSVCERGCPADSTCLTCGGADYWAYFRAPSGASSYTYSPVGAGATQVHDGEVEAWKWGPGVAPQFVSFAEVWGEATTTAVPATTISPPTSRPPTATTQAGAGAPPTASTGGPSSTSLPGDGVPASTAGSGALGGEAAGATGEPVSGAGGGGDAGETTAAGAGRDGAGDPGSGAPTTTGGRGGDRVGTTAPSAGGGAGTGSAQDTTAALGDGGPVGDVAVAPVAPRVDTGSGGSAAGVVEFAVVAAGLALWISRARLARRRAMPA